MCEQTVYFEYSKEATAHLCAKDKQLAQAIEHIGPVKRAVTPDLFTALVHSIISQQISTKAAETICGRLKEKCPDVTPAALLSLPVRDIQSCGITMKKAEYIHDLAEKANAGAFDIRALKTMTDEQVVAELVKLKGVGVWTAEMLLIFSMRRPDILSYGDLAIQRGLKMLYRHRAITPALCQKYKRRYSPYASVASLYLWEIASGGYEAYPLPRQKGK
ncbi:MAG TPA: DNA-3-methyladenine glycosylase 2 family protein [Clostridiales bacterium]|nr:DNA-3-methyladenine glycosylase 2 family protein [Clostridiales bacterium]